MYEETFPKRSRKQKLKLFLKVNWPIIAFLAVIIGAFVLLHTKPSNIQNVDDLSAMLTDGQPAVIEFYSDF